MPRFDHENPKESQSGSSDIFSRLPGESSEAFCAFVIYRDLGPLHRSLAETSRILQTKKSEGRTTLVFPDLPPEQQQSGGNPAAKRQRPHGQIGLWSKKWNWVERSAAWDDYLDKSRQRAYKDKVTAMAEEQSKVLQLSRKVVQIGIAEVVKALNDERRGRRWKRVNAIEAFDRALECIKQLPKLFEAERVSMGVTVTTPDLEDQSTQGGDIEWVIKTYQPPREGPAIDLSRFDEQSTKAHWEGDSPQPEHEDEAEGQAFAPKGLRR